jgi:NADPH:quinone reductase-like Zn-dependent oxidoreductase
MKAMIYQQYGPPEVFQLAEADKPVPKDNEILVKIFATSANSGDTRLRKADPWAVRLFFGLTRPRINILGGFLSGEVEAVGKGVTKYRVGDAVFGATGMSFGAYAAYKCLPQDGIISLKPGNIGHNEAGTIPFGALTALHFLKKASIKKGQKLLVYGASGAVGTAAVQLAKYFGAEVTAVCSTANIEMVKSLGADKAIDYKKEDFTRNGIKYDVIYETVNKISFTDIVRSLKKGGVLLLGASGPSYMLRGAITSMTGKYKVVTGVTKQTAEGIALLKTLIEAGNYKPVVDSTYDLEQMAEAHRYVELGHKKGNVAIIVTDK